MDYYKHYIEMYRNATEKDRICPIISSCMKIEIDDYERAAENRLEQEA